MTKVSASDLRVFIGFTNHRGECHDAETPQLCQWIDLAPLGGQTDFYIQF